MDGLNVDYNQLYSKARADCIFRQLEDEIEYLEGCKVLVRGKWYDIPRKQAAFGDPGLTYTFSGQTVSALPWTPLLRSLKLDAERASNYRFNFLLVNRYKDGKDCIGEHRDDEKDLILTAPIASLSFGQPREFVLRHRDLKFSGTGPEPVKVLLEHGSCLTMNYPTNLIWYHSLPANRRLFNPRINLTFRALSYK